MNVGPSQRQSPIYLSLIYGRPRGCALQRACRRLFKFVLRSTCSRLLSRDHDPSYYYCTSAMSNTPSTSTSSSNFRTIFVAAIKEYEKKTKTDLHTHPLSTRLQSCNSSSDILAVLHDKVNEFDESRCHNERLSSWLNPTINVLCAFSGTVAQGAGLVSPNGRICRRFAHNWFHRYSHLRMSYLLVSGFSSW
jgi:hypothetical protein